MSIEQIWQKEDWTSQARNLINNLHKFPRNSNIIMILRHSYRDSSDDMWEVSRFKLTEIGHEIARKFGEKLSTDRPIQIFYSGIERCKETAEDILLGFQKKGGIGQLKEPLRELYDLGMNEDMFFKQITMYPYTEFLYRWAAGLYSNDVIIPFAKFCREGAKVICDKTNYNVKNSLDIHVSHDLITLSFRLGWFGLSPNDFWPSFLGGFAFAFDNDKILLLDNDGFKKIELPFWWKANKKS